MRELRAVPVYFLECLCAFVTGPGDVSGSDSTVLYICLAEPCKEA